MSRNRDRAPQRTSRPTALDEARNELFGHIHRCGVMKASPDQQQEWMKDTVEFLKERHSALTERELKELETIGLRFCSPVISNAADVEPAVAETHEDAEQEQEPAAA
ncbi:hypothetical protein [Longimicrobium terrae]|uniref:Uncharacterized protein n=1 Tax=Longimicrobium terrae TaxID=1639882 RepID=A0A841H0U6_9BACT|nr:hypothetical protein [Longimicrobium terrae]MBB4637103.1 hypothetical protein [Longimicrobium terrae]MBB6071637.1 hypothetical protein [Longimicrobium terrae]NNC29947.1 hypothetical protein [Longimicrobium terrae]